MVSKTATIFLLIHTLITLYITSTLQSFTNSTTKFDVLPPLIITLFTLLIHLCYSFPLFLILRLLQYCIPIRSRVTLKRHLVTAVLLAPVLAHLGGRYLGVLETDGEGVEKAAACYEQVGLEGNALTKSLYCEVRYGVKRGEVERRIGVRRERLWFGEVLAGVCIEGLRDVEHFERGVEGVCWMGKRSPNPDEWDETRGDETRNSEEEYTRRAFEECHAKFGIEVMVEWRDGFPVTTFRVPDVGVLKNGGKWMEIGNMEQLLDPLMYG